MSFVRQTSKEAYASLKESGVLGERTWQVYEALFNHGPMTQTECWKRFEPFGIGLQSITPRFAWLHRKGLVQYLLDDFGLPLKRPCKFSGMKCMVWDVTDRSTPMDVKQPSSRLARATERIRLLEKQVEAVTAERDEALRKLARWGRPTEAARLERQMKAESTPELFSEKIPHKEVASV